MNTTPASPENKTSPTWRSIAFKVIKALLTIAVIVFVIVQLVKNWNSVQAYEWDLDVPLLVASIAAQVVTFVLFSHMVTILFRGFGYEVKLKHAFKIAYIANLGRYVPGRIWPVFTLSYLGKTIKIDEQVSVAAWAVSLIISLPGSILAGLVCIWLVPELQPHAITAMPVSLGTLALIVGVISAILVVAPNTSLFIYNLILRLLRMKPVKLRLTFPMALKVFCGYLLCWVVFGLAFWLFLLSIAPDADISPIAAIGVFVISYQIGYLAIFSPGGVGVRELVMTAMLATYVGPIAPAVAVASRLWNLVSEIIASLVALKIDPGEGVKKLDENGQAQRQ